MKEQTLTRKELYDLIWSTPFTTLAKKYSISDVELRKICVKMEIPLPKSGHWAKVKANKAVEILKLSKKYSGKNEVTIKEFEEGDNVIKNNLSPLTTLEQEIIAKEGQVLIVPDRLTNPHKFIISTREFLTNKKITYDHKDYQRLINEELHIDVTRDNIPRALLFMDTFIKVMENRGHQIIIKDRKTFVIIQGEEIQIYIREQHKKIPKPSNYSWQEYNFIPTGIFYFNIRVSWQITTIMKDGRNTLEEQLAKIIAKLEIKGEELKKESIEREIRHKKREEEERVRQEKQKRKDKEFDDFKTFYKNSIRSQEAEFLRNYVNKIEADAKRKNNYTDKLKKWIIWARKKADWYDPLIDLYDKYLIESDKDNLTSEKKQNPFNPYYY